MNGAASSAGDAQRPQITRALTVRQPWAWAIAAGIKKCENRSWGTSHRGWFAIHSASTMADAVEGARCAEIAGACGGVAAPPTELLVRSAIIAVVFLEEVFAPDKALDDAWAQPGCFHWLLRDARPLKEPVQCLGQRDLWRPSDEVLAAIHSQL